MTNKITSKEIIFLCVIFFGASEAFGIFNSLAYALITGLIVGLLISILVCMERIYKKINDEKNCN